MQKHKSIKNKSRILISIFFVQKIKPLLCQTTNARESQRSIFSEPFFL